MIFRPGQRLVIPDVQVFQPLVSSPSGGWWDNNGVISGCVAAYAAKGAADLASSYINLANPGTYNAAPGVAPTFNTADGWTFNGTTQYLTTGISPANDQTWSWIVRFSNGPTAQQQQLFGSGNTGPAGPYFGFMPYWGPGNIGYFLNGGFLSLTGNTSGVHAAAGNKAYMNGTVQAGSIATNAGTIQPLYIGCRNQGGTAVNFINAKIQALAIYSTTLAAGEVATLTTLMAAL